MTTEPLPPPLAHHVCPGDAAAFEAKGQCCEFPRCRGLIEIRTLARYWWIGKVCSVEHFYCLDHGEVFADFYGVPVGPAPDVSGMGGAS